MDLDKIEEVIKRKYLDDNSKRLSILHIISEDEKALEDMMYILNAERIRKKELILEMNMQLSRADAFIQQPALADKSFILSKIKKFYEQFKGQVSHCFPISSNQTNDQPTNKSENQRSS